MNQHTHDEKCEVCDKELIEYKCCPKCGGDTARIMHVSYDDIYFLKQGKWYLGKAKVRGAYSNRYQCMNASCAWISTR